MGEICQHLYASSMRRPAGLDVPLRSQPGRAVGRPDGSGGLRKQVKNRKFRQFQSTPGPALP
jgi:hypothetical protein